jgi:hypothetical protein
MKRLMFVLALLLTPATAFADWAYVYYAAPNFYLRTNGVTNDGNAYTRCLYGGCYSYQYYGPLPNAQPAYTAPSVDSPTFETDLVDRLYQIRTQEVRLQALRESGLMNPSTSPGVSGSAYGYQTSGFQTLSQGFTGYNAQGSSLWGLAALPSNSYDSGLAVHEFQRGVDANSAAASQILSQTGSLVGQMASASAQNDATKLQVAKILALGLASQPSSTSTTQFQTTPMLPVDPNQPAQQPAQNPVNPPPVVPPNPTPAPTQNKAALEQTYIGAGWTAIKTDCINCHGGKPDIKPGGGFDFTNLSKLPATDRSNFAQEAYRRMMLAPTDAEHMPKGGRSEPKATAEAVTVTIQGHL